MLFSGLDTFHVFKDAALSSNSSGSIIVEQKQLAEVDRWRNGLVL
jgi:hypothetical protein